MAKLTPKQATFWTRFLVHGNATRAAIEAGFSEKSAHVTGARLLNHPLIRQLMAQRLEASKITADMVLQELRRLATYDPGKLYDAEGNRIPVHELDEDTRRAVAQVEDETQESLGEADAEGVKPLIVTRKQKIRMAEKGQNLERLGKYLKLFGDGGEFSATVQPGPGGLPADSSIKIVLVRPE